MSRPFGNNVVGQFLTTRVLASLGTLFVVSVLIFAGTELLPGDVASHILGQQSTPDAVAALREKLDLDRPLTTRYWEWLSGFVQGDLGQSAATTLAGSNARVTDVIGDRLRNSAILAGLAFLLMVPISLALGVLTAAKAGQRVDHGFAAASLAVIALPEFVIGALLIVLLGGGLLDWFPPVVVLPTGASPLSEPMALVLPVLTLVLVTAASTMRLVRASMLEVLRSGYVEMARLNGLNERRVLTRYALRNAFAPTVQVLAVNTAYLIGGVVVVEAVFGYPGIGQLLVSSVTIRDVPVVQSVCMIIAIIYVTLYLLADLAVVLLIPKLRTARR